MGSMPSANEMILRLRPTYASMELRVMLLYGMSMIVGRLARRLAYSSSLTAGLAELSKQSSSKVRYCLANHASIRLSTS